MKIKFWDVEGRQRFRRLPRSDGWRRAGTSASAIFTSAIMLGLLFLCPMALAQGEELECHYSGQTYQFNTPCDDDWIYAWTATFKDEPGVNAGEFVEGPIPNSCSVNWVAPMVYEETLVNLTVLVTNVYDEDDIFDPISCIAMDNITVLVCPLADITVVKNSIPDDPQEFDFSFTDKPDFSLVDDGTPRTARLSPISCREAT